MGRKAVGPVCCVMHVKEPRTFIEKEKGLAPVILDLRLEHPVGWICARYKSSVLLLLSNSQLWTNVWQCILKHTIYNHKINNYLHCTNLNNFLFFSTTKSEIVIGVITSKSPTVIPVWRIANLTSVPQESSEGLQRSSRHVARRHIRGCGNWREAMITLAMGEFILLRSHYKDHIWEMCFVKITFCLVSLPWISF